MLILALLYHLLLPQAASAEIIEPPACVGTYNVSGTITLTTPNGSSISIDEINTTVSDVTETALPETNTTASEETSTETTVEENTATIVETETQPQPIPTGALVINEFVSDPETGNKEWVEIKNTTNTTLSLEDIKIYDNSNHSRTLTGTLGSNSLLVVELSTSILNNDGDAIYLKNANGNVIDYVVYGNTANAAVGVIEKGESAGRNGNGLFQVSTTPTPGAVNQFPEVVEEVVTEVVVPEVTETTTEETTSAEVVTENPITETVVEATPATLLFSELYPIPNTNEDEWLEIENAGDVSTDLTGWYLTDASGAKTMLSGEISAHGFYLVPKPKGNLNNTGDTMTIFDPTDTQVDQVSYTPSDEIGKSEAWALASGVWGRTTIPTPGTQNIIEVPEEPADDEVVVSQSGSSSTPLETTLLAARDLPLQTLIHTHGTVAVPLGIFGTNTFYVSGSGMKIFLSGVDPLELAIGDEIEITGKTSSSGNEKRIVVSNPSGIIITGHSEAPVPTVIETDQVDDATEGYLVTIEGTAVEKTAGRFVIQDANGTVPVIVKTNTNIDETSYNIGETMRVTGFVSETTSGFRILPRAQTDIEITGTAALPEAGDLARQYSLFTPLAAGFISVISIMVTRKTLQLKKNKKNKKVAMEKDLPVL